MKFGIYIRSIGERTEQLCIDSCKQYIDSEDIHILRNYFPSYNVYREMFNRAEKSDYDWFLAVDADVVLSPNWHDMVIEKIEGVDPKNTFKFTFRVYDPIYCNLIDRGNHVYNNTFTPLAIGALKKNILISRLPRIFKRFFNSGYYLKPETSLRGVLKEKHGLSNFNYPEVIGIHGTEQYYCEIFRTFLIRSKRNPEWINKYEFLQKNKQKQLFLQNEFELYVANLGWHHGDSCALNKIDSINIGLYQEILKKFKIQEREPLEMAIGEFYEKYF